MYINTETMEYPISEQEIRNLYPGISFPTPFVPPPQFSFVFEPTKPSFDWITEGIRQTTPIFNTDLSAWYETWEVYQLTPDQIAVNEMLAREANSTKATKLLQQSDWTCTVDINNPEFSNPYLGNQPEFLAYRSALRDIAVNPPIVVDVWPVAPNEIWLKPA